MHTASGVLHAAKAVAERHFTSHKIFVNSKTQPPELIFVVLNFVALAA